MLKAFVILLTMLIIFISIIFGWVLIVGPLSITLLGVVFGTRSFWQIIRARKHLWQTRAVYLPFLRALHTVFPDDFSEKDILKWHRKRLNAELWMRALLKKYPKLQERENWQLVIKETFNQFTLEEWLEAFPEKEDVTAIKNAYNAGNIWAFVENVLCGVVPVYGITADEIAETLNALKNQTVPFKKMVIARNDPPKEDDSDEVREKKLATLTFIINWVATANASPGNTTEWSFIDLPKASKKNAIAEALKLVSSALFINVDSDTTTTPNANFWALVAFLVFPHLHGLTSNVRIKNVAFGKKAQLNEKTLLDAEMPKQSWFEKWMLPLMTYFRYDTVNRVERSARRFNESVLSGPYLVIRRATFVIFVDEWLNFLWNGKPVPMGDDRRITYFLNWMKKATAYFDQVIVYTDCPETMKRWRGQQARWTLSYYINMWDSFLTGQWRSLSKWTLFDQIYGGFFSFFLIASLTSVAVRAINLILAGNQLGVSLLIYYATIIFLVNFAKGAYCALTNRDIKGLSMTFYVWLFVRHLLPIKIFRSLTLKGQDKWFGRWLK